MYKSLHEIVLSRALEFGDAPALLHKESVLTYADFAVLIERVAAGLILAGLRKRQRVAVYLPKMIETVASFFGASYAAGIFVPVNPLLKSEQVAHILSDCSVSVLITSRDRIAALRETLVNLDSLELIVCLDEPDDDEIPGIKICSWAALTERDHSLTLPVGIDADVASIFYTSGSTGKAKGVVLSQRNMCAGAASVAEYLNNQPNDRLLAVLPLSFDYGFSQISTAFLAGASVVLMDYLFPRDVIGAIEKYGVSGLAGVPPLWNELAQLDWPEKSATGLRYITNSGGSMPQETLELLRQKLPSTEVFLMYGLTEAFRSSFLPPTEIDHRPNSIGKAIPNVELMVVNNQGQLCAPGEAGELVHRGALVSLGYWNDPEKTAHRFRKLPIQATGVVIEETAVWSGDTVTQDEDGYLYFVGRSDDMIKTSGYRVSPSEVEEALYATGIVSTAAAVGIPDSQLGQVIVVALVTATGKKPDDDQVMNVCRERLPSYMIPAAIFWYEELPVNPNGKIDRKCLLLELKDKYSDTAR